MHQLIDALNNVVLNTVKPGINFWQAEREGNNLTDMLYFATFLAAITL